MARTIQFDLKVGGGEPPLYGSLTIYGTVPAVNGSGWVVTSETTLRLINGQATLTGALERPSDGSRGHYHVIARDNCGRGASFRKFLPVGAGAISLAAMPDAWSSM